MPEMNVKALVEKRNNLLIELDKLATSVSDEVRAMTAEEETDYQNKMEEVKRLGTTIDAIRSRMTTEQRAVGNEESESQREERAFDAFLRSGEIRADAGMSASENGVIIPKTIADRIIDEVKELSQIFALASKFYVKGELTFPMWSEQDNNIVCTYTEEFTETDAKAGKFTGITLKEFLITAQVKISKKLINNAAFDVVAYVTHKIAEAYADFYDRECIHGTAGKMEGVLSGDVGVTAASETKITADELIRLQAKIKRPHQKNARWLMHPDTFTELKTLKTTDGHYLLTQDFTQGFGWLLLGRPVEISENMPKIAKGEIPIIYGDFSGLYVKFARNVDVQILKEVYAKQYATGISTFAEIDAKLVERQKIRTLKMAGTKAAEDADKDTDSEKTE